MHTPSTRRWSAAFLIVILAGSVTQAVNRQSQPPQNPALRFEVASLRVRGGLDPIGLLAYRVSPGRWSHPCATLRTLLFFAYRLNTSTPMEGFPSWGSVPCGAPGFPVGDTYNFQATMPTDTTDDQMRQMMQTFL